MKNLYKSMLFACISLITSNSLQASNNINDDMRNIDTIPTVSTNILKDNDKNELHSGPNNNVIIANNNYNNKIFTITYYYDGIEKTLNTSKFQVNRYPTLNILTNMNQQQDHSIDDLLNLLSKIFKDIKQVNTDIDNKKFNDTNLNGCNYLMGEELLLVFSNLIDETINKLLNTSTVKAYNLENKINEFKTDYILYCGDNEKLDKILIGLKNYIEYKKTYFVPHIHINDITKHSFYPKNK